MGHTHFEEDDDENLPDATPSQPAETMVACPPASTSRSACCCSSVRVDNKKKDACYVFKVVCNPTSRVAAASLSSGIIRSFAITNTELSPSGELRGHQDKINDMKFLSPTEQPTILHSCSSDGTVRGWDMRSSQQVEEFKCQQELFSFSALDNVVAGGGQGEVLFWDRRNSSVGLASLADTHMDDVTQVKFHAASRHVISASQDGLIAVHDTTRSLSNDDDSFVAALNLDTSVEELDTYGPLGERLWVRTGTESLHLWDWQRAIVDAKQGGHAAFASWPEARVTAAQAAGASSQASLFEEVDYLIGCHYDPSGRLLMVAGTLAGNIGFFPLTETCSEADTSMMTGASMGAPIMTLTGAHTDIVRSVQCWGDSLPGGICGISGGEDSQVCLWSTDPTTVVTNKGSSAGVGGTAGQAGAGGGYGSNLSGGQGQYGGGGG
eukprot:gene18394-24866_t